MQSTTFGDQDHQQLTERGIAVEEAQRQLKVLRSPPPAADLDRPCTVGDGIERLGESQAQARIGRFESAAAAGRVTKMVPASGAASRMFRSLLPYLEEPQKARREELQAQAEAGDDGAQDVLRLADEIDRFAFRDELAEALERQGSSLDQIRDSGDYGPLLAALLGPKGLALASLPKGLIPFHSYPDGARTPFGEHLVEAMAYARDDQDRCRLHFTVTPAHRQRVTQHLDQTASQLGDARFLVSYSEQSPATDTLSLDEHGEPFRLDDGTLLLRPGGHGSLLLNLEELRGDVVLVKNIDNVQPERLLPTVARWKKLLGGFLLELEEEIHGLLRRLHGDSGKDDAENGAAVDQALELIARRFDSRASEIPRERRRTYAMDRLNRPLRICGMVVNRGEPGGGPFWVKDGSGACSPQIVESAQISHRQRSLLRGATHFNPVDLVCSLKDWRGEPFPLRHFVDPDTAFVTSKSYAGRPLTGLEHPGLWNGAMAGWNTVFVEVPAETFSPVKTVFDLLRAEHQPAP
ncbi:MAG: DUF4301 family protein [Acidobacteriota bacterium]|nr:DUF4301 family protein [Acidobacteriota bacterium]